MSRVQFLQQGKHCAVPVMAVARDSTLKALLK